MPSREGADLIGQLFESLGYTVEIGGHPLDEHFPEWSSSMRPASTTRPRNLLSRLHVQLLVLDNHKHYRMGDVKVVKLLRFGEGWLGSHPLRDLIVYRQCWPCSAVLEPPRMWRRQIDWLPLPIRCTAALIVALLVVGFRPPAWTVCAEQYPISGPFIPCQTVGTDAGLPRFNLPTRLCVCPGAPGTITL